jgi:hypothetical protein
LRITAGLNRAETLDREVSPSSKMASEEGNEELHQEINKCASDGVDDAFWAGQDDGHKTKKSKFDHKP